MAVRALRRRGAPAAATMGALLVGLVTSYHALILAVLVAVPMLRAFYVVDARILLVLVLFTAAAVGVPALILQLWRRGVPWLRRAMARRPQLEGWWRAAEATPTTLLSDHRLWLRAMALQLTEVVLDAATLLAMLTALGTPVDPAAAFACFVVASAVFRILPVPLGLGTFEGTLVGMLRLVHVPIEAALAATLLFRGLTLWLPMLPGLWWTRRELAGPALTSTG